MNETNLIEADLEVPLPTAAADGSAHRRMPMQFMVLALFVVVGGGAIFLMRQAGLGPSIAMAKDRIDTMALDAQEAGSTAEHLRVLADLKRAEKPVQFGAGVLPRNAFSVAIEASLADPVSAEIQNRDVEAERRAAEREQQRLENERKKQQVLTALRSIKLHSVFTGLNPTASVNGELVRVGDDIGDLLKVTRIEGRSIEIEGAGLRFLVTMDGEVIGPIGEDGKGERLEPLPKQPEESLDPMEVELQSGLGDIDEESGERH